MILKNGGIGLGELENKIIKCHSRMDPIALQSTMEKFWVSMTRIIEGIHLLHSNGIIHNDIKQQNILINDNFRSNLIDFGLMTTRDKLINKTIHDYFAYPPEVYFYKRFIAVNLQENKNIRNSNFFKKRIKEFARSRIRKNNPYMKQHLFSTMVFKNDEDFNEYYINKFVDFTTQLSIDSYENFMEVSLDTFDMYGLGLVLLSMLYKTGIYLKNNHLFDDLYQLFMVMTSWNVYERYKPSDVLSQYKQIMNKYGLLEKYNDLVINPDESSNNINTVFSNLTEAEEKLKNTDSTSKSASSDKSSSKPSTPNSKIGGKRGKKSKKYRSKKKENKKTKRCK